MATGSLSNPLDSNLDLSTVAGASLSAARMLVVMGPHGVRRHALPEAGVLQIGRSARADIRIPLRSVSRCHAELLIGQHVVIRDPGSSNGVVVDLRERLSGGQATTIVPGQIVWVGDAYLFCTMPLEVQMSRYAA